MGYSIKHKMLTLQKVLPPENRPVNEVSRESGISAQTIYKWIKQARDGMIGTGVPDSTIPKEKTDIEKFSILLESRGINEDQKGEWLRRNGLHSEHLTSWEQELAGKMTNNNESISSLKEQNRNLQKDNKKLQKELKRNQAALAEMAALYALKKKAEEYWPETEDEK